MRRDRKQYHCSAFLIAIGAYIHLHTYDHEAFLPAQEHPILDAILASPSLRTVLGSFSNHFPQSHVWHIRYQPPDTMPSLCRTCSKLPELAGRAAIALSTAKSPPSTRNPSSMDKIVAEGHFLGAANDKVQGQSASVFLVGRKSPTVATISLRSFMVWFLAPGSCECCHCHRSAKAKDVPPAERHLLVRCQGAGCPLT